MISICWSYSRAAPKSVVWRATFYEAVGALDFSKDILLSEEGHFEQSRALVNSLQAEAVRDGVTLYENGRTDRAIEKICR